MTLKGEILKGLEIKKSFLDLDTMFPDNPISSIKSTVYKLIKEGYIEQINKEFIIKNVEINKKVELIQNNYLVKNNVISQKSDEEKKDFFHIKSKRKLLDEVIQNAIETFSNNNNQIIESDMKNMFYKFPKYDDVALKLSKNENYKYDADIPTSDNILLYLTHSKQGYVNTDVKFNHKIFNRTKPLLSLIEDSKRIYKLPLVLIRNERGKRQLDGIVRISETSSYKFKMSELVHIFKEIGVKNTIKFRERLRFIYEESDDMFFVLIENSDVGIMIKNCIEESYCADYVLI